MSTGPLGLGILPNFGKAKPPSMRKSFRTGDNAAIGRFVLSLPKGSAFIVQNRGSKTTIAVWNNPADVPASVPR